MEVKNLAIAIIGISIAWIMIGGALVPAVDSAIKTNMDVEQNPTYFFSAFKDYGGDVELTPTNSALIINGVENTTGFVVSSNYALEYSSGTNSYSFKMFSLEFGIKEGITGAYIHEDGTVTINIGDESYTTTEAPEFVFISDPNGTWGDFRNSSFHVSYGNTVYVTHTGNFNFGGVATNVYYSAKIERGIYTDVNAHILDTDTSEYVPADISISDEEIVEYSGNYGMHSSVMLNYNGESYKDLYAFVFAPIDYRVENEQQGIINSIFATIPLIVIAGLVMTGVYVFISRK